MYVDILLATFTLLTREVERYSEQHYFKKGHIHFCQKRLWKVSFQNKQLTRFLFKSKIISDKWEHDPVCEAELGAAEAVHDQAGPEVTTREKNNKIILH